MMRSETSRKGWCPGALRPMLTGDGLLVRIRPRAGTFTLRELRAIADAAQRFGSGDIDLTNRANLQLRGLSEATYPGALAALNTLGLIDRDPGTESVRNIVVDPLSGLQPGRPDMRPLARALERLIETRRELHALPSKFGFCFDGASPSSKSLATSDISISPFHDGTYALHLAGDPETCALVAGGDVAEAAGRLACAFLSFRSGGEKVRRMRHAVALHGSAALFTAASLAATRHGAREPSTDNPAIVGVLDQGSRPFACGLGLPFGRIAASHLVALGEAAAEAGIIEVRPSPARVLVFPVQDVSGASRLLARGIDLGLIVSPLDPRLTMDVCPGAPSCPNASTATRSDAGLLIDVLSELPKPVPSVHVSGCAKGCARSTAAALTLVARGGRYDLIRGGTTAGPIHVSGILPQDLARHARRLLTETES